VTSIHNNAQFPLQGGGTVELPRGLEPVVVDRGSTIDVRIDGQTYTLACTKSEFDAEFYKSLAEQHKLTTVKNAHPPLDTRSPNAGYGVTGAEAKGVRVAPTKVERNKKWDERDAERRS
jgi:hypothetical protein